MRDGRDVVPEAAIKVLLLENIHPSAAEVFAGEGFQVEASRARSPRTSSPSACATSTSSASAARRRSRRGARRGAPAARGGCFCIGTNQVDLDAANRRGVPVFNAPFSNTRSVAELIIAEIVMLARQLGDRSREVHAGKWRKVAAGCYEVRGKTLGIVGYGHIGSQVGVLAEAIGMRVIFYDIAAKLPMGNNRAVETLEELLEVSRLRHAARARDAADQGHDRRRRARADEAGRVPAQRQPRHGGRHRRARRGACSAAHLAGAAIDVYPEEPEANSGRLRERRCAACRT